jgi:hypothetical protein
MTKKGFSKNLVGTISQTFTIKNFTSKKLRVQVVIRLFFAKEILSCLTWANIVNNLDGLILILICLNKHAFTEFYWILLETKKERIKRFFEE